MRENEMTAEHRTNKIKTQSCSKIYLLFSFSFLFFYDTYNTAPKEKFNNNLTSLHSSHPKSAFSALNGLLHLQENNSAIRKAGYSGLMVWSRIGALPIRSPLISAPLGFYLCFIFRFDIDADSHCAGRQAVCSVKRSKTMAAG
jgi:hypothetical protein